MSDRTKKITVSVLIITGILMCCTVLLQRHPDRKLTAAANEHDPLLIEPVSLPVGGTVSANTTDPQELTVLPGIGETIAEAWVAEYFSNGPYYYPEDILSIRGIGEKKLKDIAELVDIYAE